MRYLLIALGVIVTSTCLQACSNQNQSDKPEAAAIQQKGIPVQTEEEREEREKILENQPPD